MTLQKLLDDLSNKMSEIEKLDQTSEDYVAAVKEASDLKVKIDQIEEANKQVETLNAHKPATVGLAQSLQPAKDIGHVRSVKPGFHDDPKCGFNNGGEFLANVIKFQDKPNQDDRINYLYQTAGTHTTIADGLVIPPEFAEGLLLNESGVTEQDWMAKHMIEQTSSNSKTFKRSASNTLGGSVGIRASRIVENTQMSSTKEVFETVTLGLEKIYAYSEVTEEDMEDIPWLEGHLNMQAPKVIRKELAGEFLNGTGVGQALGMFNTNNSNKIQVTRNTASDIKAEDIAAMYARAIVSPNSYWLINRTGMAKLPLMTVGDHGVTWQEFFENGSIGFLNGLPLYLSEHNSALGTAGDLRLINPDGYRILEKVGGSKFASSMHVKFDYDVMALRWTHRINAMPWANDVYTPTNGDTLSAFVELGVPA